ncbi:MAG TPA: redoxin domain-containing protein [Gemmatimonadaceae bacterium]|nr:redoxin domain-containing protein [Gemmatimonadaceae bacterium]
MIHELNSAPKRTAAYWEVHVAWSLVVLLAGITLILTIRHRALRNEFLTHRRSDVRMTAGTYVPPFSARSTDGATYRVGEDNGTNGYVQVVTVLTAQCPFCATTLPVWKSIHSALTSDSLDVGFFALTTDSMEIASQYVQANSVPFPVIPFPHRKYVHLYRSFVVPQTLVIGGDGRVVYARSGVLERGPAVDSIFAAVRAARATDYRRR